jgi:hypothetical protein
LQDRHIVDLVSGYHRGQAWLTAREGCMGLRYFLHHVVAGGNPPVTGDDEASAQVIPLCVGDAHDASVWSVHCIVTPATANLGL